MGNGVCSVVLKLGKAVVVMRVPPLNFHCDSLAWMKTSEGNFVLPEYFMKRTLKDQWMASFLLAILNALHS